MADEGRRAACQRVAERFPELARTRPTVEQRGGVRVFTFRRDMSTGPGSPTVVQIVRVTVDDRGAVLKVAVSR